MIFDDVTNYYFWSVLTAWLISSLIKMIIFSSKKKKPDILSGFNNGGMPSSHAALMGAITFALLLEQGLSHTFFLSFVISTLILRDAVTVRREVGLIGEKLNELLKDKKEKIKVVYGHTLPQVIVGLLIGILSSTIFYII